jgi:hypothetical protein
MRKTTIVEDAVAVPNMECCKDHNVYVGFVIDTESGIITHTELVSVCEGEEWPGEAS